MPQPLTPLGFDVPGYAPPQVKAPTSLAQPDTTGLQVLQQSAAQTQSTIQLQQQNAQTIAQTVESVAKSQAQSVEALSQASAQEAQIRATRSSNNAQTFGQLGETILRYTSEYAKQKAVKDEAQRKAMLAAQKNAAVNDLENVRVDWIEKGEIDRQGTSAYRDTVAATLSRYEVDPADVAELTQRYFDPALDYAKRTEANRQTAAEEVTKQQRRIEVSGLQGTISASLGGLRASVGLSQEVVDTHYNNIRTSIGEMMANEKVPIIDRLTAVATALEETNGVMRERNVDTAKLNQDVAAFGTVLKFANDQQAKLRNNEITFDEYSNSVKIEAIRNNLPGFSVPDPNASEAYLRDTLTTADAINELRMKQKLNQLQSITAKDDIIGALTTQFVLDPTSYLNVKGKPDKELDPNARAALQVYEEFKAWRDNDVPKYNANQAQYNTSIQGKIADFDRWFISASRDTSAAARDPSYSKIMEALRMNNDPNFAAIASGKRPLTQEDVNAMQAAYTREVEATKAEASTASATYANQQAKFAKYGLFLDVNATKAANKRFQGSLQKYREEIAKIEASAATAGTQPGNSPNFNGGAPGKPKNWKPLAVSNYGGKKITFPFTQDVAATLVLESGQDFNAGRGGRQHNALDFAVPVGTPVQSLVYGTVIDVGPDRGGYGTVVEVKGDDGFTYHYAHLSKTLVAKGERVGAGQGLALSGNTGVGSGPHLHFDLLDPNGKVVDPLTHLATRKFGDAPRNPRSSGTSAGQADPRIKDGKVYVSHKEMADGNKQAVGYNAKGGAWQRIEDLPASLVRKLKLKNATPVSHVLPPDAIPLGGDTYLTGGKVIRYNIATPVSYSNASPLRNSAAGKGDNSPTANHGYAALAKDKALAKALNAEAKRQGIPSQWLADLISFESANTFSPGVPNGLGYFGLIQFGPEAAQDLGVTREQLTRMSAAQQMVYVGKYLDLQKRYAGISGNFKNVAELIAAVNQGHTVLRDVRNRGQAAVEDPQNRDGAGMTLKRYVEDLGKYSGRRYDSSRVNRVSAVTHTGLHPNCTMCNALSQQLAFVPHEAQNVT